MRKNSRKEQEAHGGTIKLEEVDALVSQTVISLYIVIQSER